MLLFFLNACKSVYLSVCPYLLRLFVCLFSLLCLIYKCTYICMLLYLLHDVVLVKVCVFLFLLVLLHHFRSLLQMVKKKIFYINFLSFSYCCSVICGSCCHHPHRSGSGSLKKNVFCTKNTNSNNNNKSNTSIELQLIAKAWTVVWILEPTAC